MAHTNSAGIRLIRTHTEPVPEEQREPRSRPVTQLSETSPILPGWMEEEHHLRSDRSPSAKFMEKWGDRLLTPGKHAEETWEIRYQGRLSFLETIQSHTHWVLTSLYSTCIGPFDAAFSTYLRNCRSANPTLKTFVKEVLYGNGQPDPQSTQNLLQHLERWALRFHLTADWCRETAIVSLAEWHRTMGTQASRVQQQTLRWSRYQVFPEVELSWLGKPQVFTFELRHGWYPGWLDRRALRDAIVDDIQNQVDEYLERAEAEARELGLLAERSSQVTDQHWLWLVLYQVCGHSWTRIALDDSRSRSTRPPYRTATNVVSRAGKNAAAVIGLDIRPETRPRVTSKRTARRNTRSVTRSSKTGRSPNRVDENTL